MKTLAKDKQRQEAIIKRLNSINMEKAELLNELRSLPTFALEYIKTEINKLLGKYFNTPNPAKIYIFLSGSVEYTNNKYIVLLNVKHYYKEGNTEDSTYTLVSDKLPSDVYSWLTMGNVQIESSEAKLFINKALLEEKKKLTLNQPNNSLYPKGTGCCLMHPNGQE